MTSIFSHRRSICFWLILLFLLILSSCSCEESDNDPTSPADLEQKLVGTWEGSDGLDTIVITFEENGDVALTSVSATDNSPTSSSGTYTVDFSFTPAHLDFMWDTGYTFLTIVEFVDDNTIRLDNRQDDSQRPTSFGDDTVIFTRSVR